MRVVMTPAAVSATRTAHLRTASPMDNCAWVVCAAVRLAGADPLYARMTQQYAIITRRP